MKILTIGGATQDIFIVYEDAQTLHLRTKHGQKSYLLLEEGSKVEVKELLYSSGGGANNTAISFKRQGFDITPLFKIGNDEAGTFIIKKLHDEGIDGKHIIISQGKTGISFIIPSLEHDRTILAFRGVNGTMTQEEIPFHEIKNYDYLYITSLSGVTSQLLLPIAQQAKQHNIPVATNPGTSQLVAGAATLRESLPYINILILNSAEAKQCMASMLQSTNSLKKSPKKSEKNNGSKPELLAESINIEHSWFTLPNFFQAVLNYGPRVVVVTNGAEGVYVATENVIYFHPSLPVTVVNTVGAGDAFGSGFVGALATGKSVEQAIQHGIINATSVISHMDTKQGLLSMHELEKRAHALDKNLLKKFGLKE